MRGRAVALVSVLAVLGGCTAPEGVDAAAEPTTSAPRTTSAPPEPPLVVAYGDSYVGPGVGAELPSGWPALVADDLDLELVNHGHAGSGYTNWEVGWSYPYTIATEPPPEDADVVIVFGGFNDITLAPEAVRQDAVATFALIEAAAPQAELLVIGPEWPRQEPTVELYTLRDALADAAREAGATFVDASGWLMGRPELIASDGLHLNEDGHAVFAAQIAPTLAGLISGR
ncbi:SGNH/GDSL hydrolase family protein [Geodermatophilus sabuli]|uniref:SGNH/GDSL hydrolase family protein n=1 Tax=Geodermatophilus sabuli TaxID=1564158 RepID=A0A7K3VYN2_9ACTN|nr:SGNH/GDSL hydrolase family protein [Geodermatophilus sabuli]NEK57223.1 SGNH/GDSL hydrolase family protein [Geodermatophilus sabuli]